LEAGGANVYLYVEGNPVRFADPEGLQKGGMQSTWGVPYTPPQSTAAPTYNPSADPLRYTRSQLREQQREILNDPLIGMFGAKRVCIERSCQVAQGGVCTPSNPTGQPQFATGPFITAPGASPIGCPCRSYGWVTP
jgi:hypothetical protein